MLVRKRFSTRNPGESHRLRRRPAADTTRAGGPVWFGGGKLAADLTLPKLRCRWSATCPRSQVTASPQQNEPRSGSMPPAPRRVPRSRSATSPLTDPAAAADAAWAAADTLHAAAAALGSRVLRQAADSYRPRRPRSVRPDPGSAPSRATTSAARPGCYPPPHP